MKLSINSFFFLIGLLIVISCKQTVVSSESDIKSLKTKDNSVNYIEESVIDTFYLSTSQVIFFRPNEERYNELVQKYGQTVIEADSDFGFAIKNLTENNFNTKVTIRVIKNNSVVYDRIGNEIHLPKEETNSYGAIFFSKKLDSLKTFNGIFPFEFYIEELNNWEW